MPENAKICQAALNVARCRERPGVRLTPKHVRKRGCGKMVWHSARCSAARAVRLYAPSGIMRRPAPVVRIVRRKPGFPGSEIVDLLGRLGVEKLAGVPAGYTQGALAGLPAEAQSRHRRVGRVVRIRGLSGTLPLCSMHAKKRSRQRTRRIRICPRPTRCPVKSAAPGARSRHAMATGNVTAAASTSDTKGSE